MKEKIKFAFAVNHSNNFETLHFGEVDKYLIYEWNGNEIIFTNEIINEFKLLDEKQEHGSKMKGELIIDMFKKNDIKVLVSKQFGPNVKMVNEFFIPVIIYNDTTGDVIRALKRHIFWIQDELNNRPKEFKLFTIKQGILKTPISDKK
jgi:predicted Fe-Mo cluster-binding NifX family protein